MCHGIRETEMREREREVSVENDAALSRLKGRTFRKVPRRIRACSRQPFVHSLAQ